MTLRELNRALLARQLLLERQRLAVPKAVERLVAIQAQYAPLAHRDRSRMLPDEYYET